MAGIDAADARSSRYLDRFGLVLLLTVVTIVLSSLVSEPQDNGGITNFGVAALSVSGSVTLLLAIHATGVSPGWRRVANWSIGLLICLQVLAVILVRIGDAAPEETRLPPIGPVVFAALSFYLVVKRVLGHKEVTASTVLGAVSGYLLIAMVLFNTYLSMDILDSEPFFGRPESSTKFMYFSLTTLTTLGGNLEPVGNMGRLASATGSIVGQLYLVVFVAFIVGLLVARWDSQRP